MMIREESRLP